MALTVMFFHIRMFCGVDVPLKSPSHRENRHPGAGLAEQVFVESHQHELFPSAGLVVPWPSFCIVRVTASAVTEVMARIAIIDSATALALIASLP
jgi:hypothetical protein